MTSELMFKVTIVLIVVSVASSVVLKMMLRFMGTSELTRIAINKQHVLKHPFVVVVSVSNVLAKVAAAASAVTTAVLWLIGV